MSENQNNQAVSQMIQDISKELSVSSSSDINSIPEDAFVNVFLPMFAGVQPLEYPVTITNWINLAGNAFKPVHVVDNKRKILFTVPALYDIEAINPLPNVEGLSPVSHVVETAKQYSHMHPMQGSRYLNEEMAKRSMIMRNPIDLSKDIGAWNEIFKRYGYPIIEGFQDKEQTTQTLDDGGIEFEVM